MKFVSVCSGIEAATVAWAPLGWKPMWYSEIDPHANAVLAHWHPDVPNLGDITTIEPEPNHERPDLLVGGTPCQSFSVAGLRKGLDDDRGNLAFEFLRLADTLRPRWVLWENVPGVLSIDGGRAFGSILGALAAIGYGFAYRVLDAQYIRVQSHPRAVPQRRRRVFVVGYLGDWRPPCAVLLERESLQGHPPPRREAGKAVAALTASGVGAGGGPDDNAAQAGHIVRTDASRLGVREVRGDERSDMASDVRMVQPSEPVAPPLTSNPYGDHESREGLLVSEVAPTLDAHFGAKQGLEDQHINQGAGLFVSHTLRAEGHDASEDGTGRGTPIVPFGAWDSRIRSGGEVAPTLDAGKGDGVAIALASDGARRTSAEKMAVAVSLRGREGGNTPELEEGVSPSLRTGEGGSGKQHVLTSTVRRITPREAERLMGFPDSYTLVPYRGKPMADGPRYKLLGNSIAINVLRWLGERIQLCEEVLG